MGKLERMTRVFFGRGIGSGDHEVSANAWMDFLEKEVKSRLVGWTTYEARGYWKGKPEETFVLEVTHDGSESNRALVKEICELYAKRFKQQCVYRAHVIMEGSYEDFTVAPESSAYSKIPPMQPQQAADTYIVAEPPDDEATALLRAARSSHKTRPEILPVGQLPLPPK